MKRSETDAFVALRRDDGGKSPLHYVCV